MQFRLFLALLVLVLPLRVFALSDQPSPDELISLLRTGQFDTLDQKLTELQRLYEQNSNNEDAVVLAFETFERADPDLEPYFSKWVDSAPSSYSARLARGIFYQQIGWAMRGTKYIYWTPRRHIESMEFYFAKAQSDLDASVSLTNKPLLSYGYLLGMAMAEGNHKEVERLLDKSVLADVNNSFVRRRYLYSLSPQWGGSFQEMDAFVDKTRQYALSEKLNGVIAKLQGDVLSRHASDLFWRDDFAGALALHKQAAGLIEDGDFLRLVGNDYLRLEQHDVAIAYLTHAIRLNPHDTWARRFLATAYFEAQQSQLGEEQLLRAAEYGDAAACYVLGTSYQFGDNGLAIDRQKALRFYKQAAFLGNQNAQFNLGANYMHGNGVPQNDGEAVKWLSMAAEQGDDQAVNNLGLLLWYGRGGLEADPVGAFRMWAQSAVRGAGIIPWYNLSYFVPQYPPAMITLGFVLISGFLTMSTLIRRYRKQRSTRRLILAEVARLSKPVPLLYRAAGPQPLLVNQRSDLRRIRYRLRANWVMQVKADYVRSAFSVGLYSVPLACVLAVVPFVNPENNSLMSVARAIVLSIFFIWLTWFVFDAKRRAQNRGVVADMTGIRALDPHGPALRWHEVYEIRVNQKKRRIDFEGINGITLSLPFYLQGLTLRNIRNLYLCTLSRSSE